MVTTDRVLADRYLIEQEIARGGMGTVYVATDRRLNRRVAVKVLAANLAGDAGFVERFKREARAAGSLSHPNVANVFDYGEDRGDHFIVMELAAGRDLGRVVRGEGPLDPSRAAELCAQLCAALDHAHAAGIVHRDVKPSNLIVGPDDRVKVTDFGIARAAGDAKLTATGAIMGSAQYLSPEQAAGAPATPASDIYAAGLVLYEMTTGAVPFTAESPTALAIRHIEEEVPSPSSVNAAVPAAIDEIVARATAKDPRDRYVSASEMHIALQNRAGSVGTGTAPMPVPGGEETAVIAAEPAQTVWPVPGDRWNPARIGRWVLAAFGILLVVALALLVARVASSRGDRPEERQPAAREPASEAFRMPNNVVGTNYLDLASVLQRRGYEIDLESVKSELPEGAIVRTEPGPGSALAENATITLYVSEGEEGDEDSGKGHGPPDKSKGKDKEDD